MSPRTSRTVVVAETPTVTTTRPDGARYGVGSRRRRLVVTGAVVAVLFLVAGCAWALAGSSSTPASGQGSSRDQWRSWSQRFAPALASFNRDLVRASSDLGKQRRARAHSDFVAIARDAVAIRSLADSIDPTVNEDVRRLARHVAAISSTALRNWPALDVTAFSAEMGAYLSASRDLTSAVLAANARYEKP